MKMRELNVYDIERAFNTAGYNGGNLRPITCKFVKLNEDGHFVYACEWANDSDYWGERVKGNVYVEYKNEEIIADW